MVRAHYDNAFKLAEKYLNCDIPDGGFFLWLYVGDDLKFTKLLWQHMAIKVIPGSYMAVPNGGINPAAGYVRIAMVHQLEIIEEAMQRLQIFIEDIWQDNKTNE
jgi:aspartate/methionine/tyrosine aminotransferase